MKIIRFFEWESNRQPSSLQSDAVLYFSMYIILNYNISIFFLFSIDISLRALYLNLRIIRNKTLSDTLNRISLRPYVYKVTP